jgi:hypothetical protein
MAEPMTTDKDAATIRHAQLADMKEGDIAAYLRERGHGDVAHVLELRSQGKEVEIAINRCADGVRSKGYTVSPGARLLAPMADEDVPFDGSDRRE